MGREVEDPVEIVIAVGGLEQEMLRLDQLEVQEFLGRRLLAEDLDELTVGLEKRRLGGLFEAREGIRVEIEGRGEADAVGAGLFGHLGESRAVELDLVEVALRAVGLLASEVNPAAGLVDALDAADGKLGVGQLFEELAGEIIKIDLAPAAPLRGPEEALVVLEEDELGRLVDVAGVRVGEEEPRLARGRVGGEELDLILEAVEPMVCELPAVRGPLAPVEIDIEVVARLQADELLRGDVDDEQPDDGIVPAGLGIAEKLEARDGLDVVDNGVFRDRLLVELHEGDLFRIGRPPEGLILAELFRVDPIGERVAQVLGAVGGQGGLVAVHVLDVEVVAPGEGPDLEIGREDVAVLPAADADDGPLRLVGDELRRSEVVNEDLVEGLELDLLPVVEILETIEEDLDLLPSGHGVDRGQELGVVEEGRFLAGEDVGPLERCVLEGIGALAVGRPG